MSKSETDVAKKDLRCEKCRYWEPWSADGDDEPVCIVTATEQPAMGHCQVHLGLTGYNFSCQYSQAAKTRKAVVREDA